MQAFHASMSRRPAEILSRLRARIGNEFVRLADIRLGFFLATLIVVALMSVNVADATRQAETQEEAAKPQSFAIDIERRLEI